MKSIARYSSQPDDNEIWVRPNTDINRDCTQDILDAIDRAVQSLKNANQGLEVKPHRIVRFKPGFYMSRANEPIFVPDGVSIIGSGRDTVIYLDSTRQHAMFIVGMPDPKCTAADRPDLFGLMDSSFAPKPNFRRGLSSVNNLSFMAQHNDMNLGHYYSDGHSYWETESILSIDLAFKVLTASGKLSLGESIAGIGDFTGVREPCPWGLNWSYLNPDQIEFSYCTNARSGEYVGGDGLATIMLPPNTGSLYKLSLELDLSKKSINVWINGIQCAVHHIPGSSDKFRENSDWPLHIGRAGMLQANSSPITLCGFRMGKSLRYVPGETGSQQKRRDGGIVNDEYRYIDIFGEGLVGFIPLDDPISSRYLRTLDGRRLPNVGIITRGAGDGGSPNRFEDFMLWSNGSGIWVGTCLDLTMKGLHINAVSGPAVGSIMVNATYIWNVHNCVFTSSDTGIYAVNSLINVYACQFGYVGRDAIRVRGSSLYLQDPFVASIGNRTMSGFRSLPGDYGGTFWIDRGVIDTEGGHTFRLNPVVAWNRAGSRPTTVQVNGLYVAATCPSKVGVRLLQVPNSNGTARSTFNVDGNCIWEDGAKDYEADPIWEKI